MTAAKESTQSVKRDKFIVYYKQRFTLASCANILRFKLRQLLSGNYFLFKNKVIFNYVDNKINVKLGEAAQLTINENRSAKQYDIIKKDKVYRKLNK